ncbi:hypothetical protein CYY_010561 [Polysphondylium violaceum]|uniref:Uncharacterized protein n=1 Tax=Polysphondylium violaceum TaxID=133409 RepID=A0A8J4PJ33_9MYCE|nr:hypothetical protein CYY_010561 [Polysphondylium violaceum]
MKRIIDKLNGSPTLIYRSFILNQNNVYRSTNTTIANVPTLYRSFCSTTTTTAKEEKQEIIFDKNTTNTLLKDADNISSTTTLANIDDNIEIKKKI